MQINKRSHKQLNVIRQVLGFSGTAISITFIPLTNRTHSTAAFLETERDL